MVRFDLRLCPVRVAALKRLAGLLTYESGDTVRWTDLVRRGIDWVVDAGGERNKAPEGAAITKESS